MKYNANVTLKNGEFICIRNGEASDGKQVFDNFNETHAETDFLLSYPEENSFTVEQESEFLRRKAESENEVQILALVAGRVVGTAGIEAIGSKFKVKHRAEFGISVSKSFWGLGIGRALTDACIDCARKAGYTQLELSAVAENTNAIKLYKSEGFIEYGRNPKGFKSKNGEYQELVHMRLELE